MSEHEESDSTQTTRAITRWGAFSTVAGSMLGIGIFLVPPIVAQKLPSTTGFYSVWLFAGLAALSGAVSYAELGGMFPRAGGDYVFQKEAYGRSIAFASGWVLFAGIFAGSIAAMAVPLSEFQIATLLEAIGVSFPTAGDAPGGGLSDAQLLGMAIVFLVTLVNTFRVRVSSVVQTLTTIVPIVALTIGAVVLLATAGPPPEAPPTPAPEPETFFGSTLAWIDAYTAVYFAFSGWNAVIYVAGEVEDPGRSLPIGLIGGTLVVTVVYLILCGTFVTTLGYEGLAGVFEAGTATAKTAGGPAAGLAVTAIIAVAMLASINATILGGARVAYAMARERAFPTYFGELNNYEVPARALWIQAALACVLIATGTFEQILDLVGLAMMFVGALTVAALWFLRSRRPEADRPYRALGFPWFPAIYLLSSAVVVVVRTSNALTGESEAGFYPLYGIGVFLAALLVGFAWERFWNNSASGES